MESALGARADPWRELMPNPREALTYICASLSHLTAKLAESGNNRRVRALKASVRLGMAANQSRKPGAQGRHGRAVLRLQYCTAKPVSAAEEWVLGKVGCRGLRCGFGCGGEPPPAGWTDCRSRRPRLCMRHVRDCLGSTTNTH